MSNRGYLKDTRVRDMSLDDAPFPVCRRASECMSEALWEIHNGQRCFGDGALRSAVKALYPWLWDLEKGFEYVLLTKGQRGIYSILRLLGLCHRAPYADMDYPWQSVLMSDGRVVYLSGNTPLAFPTVKELEGLEAEPVLVYLCHGAVGRVDEWLSLGRRLGLIIIIDSTFEPFSSCVRSLSAPRDSIFSIEGATDCCLELCSLYPRWSGGVRAGYLIGSPNVWRRLFRLGASLKTEKLPLSPTDYIVRRAAAGALEREGREQILRAVRIFRGNLQSFGAHLAYYGLECSACGISPYVFAKFSGLSSQALCREFWERVRIKVRAADGILPFLDGCVRLSGFLSLGD